MPIRTLGPFELEEELGSGSMGVVYRARHSETGQQVALKLLSPELSENEQIIARFKRELEILKKLKHPNIVQCFGGGRLGAERFYLMEIIKGGTVSQLLKQKGRLPWQQVVEYVKQVCAALQHAHENDVVHRDLKPANLMLDQIGKVKLADFGLAKLSSGADLTAAGKTVGTYAYMAPEQISGNAPITGRTDLYALGIVCYELLTGKTPFQGKSIVEMLTQHLSKQPPKMRGEGLECPAWFEKLILQLLEKDPDNRPDDAQAVLRILDTGGPDASAETRMPKSAPTVKRRPLAAVSTPDSLKAKGDDSEKQAGDGAGPANAGGSDNTKADQPSKSQPQRSDRKLQSAFTLRRLWVVAGAITVLIFLICAVLWVNWLT